MEVRDRLAQLEGVVPTSQAGEQAFDGRSPVLDGGLPPSAHVETLRRRDAAPNVQPRIPSRDVQQHDRTPRSASIVLGPRPLLI
jgi:hypothetical protein